MSGISTDQGRTLIPTRRVGESPGRIERVAVIIPYKRDLRLGKYGTLLPEKRAAGIVRVVRPTGINPAAGRPIDERRGLFPPGHHRDKLGGSSIVSAITSSS